MVNPIINKKKLKLSFYFVISSILIFIVLIFFLFYQFFIKRDSINYLNENIEQFSSNYNFVLEQIEINELKYISKDEIPHDFYGSEKELWNKLKNIYFMLNPTKKI